MAIKNLIKSELAVGVTEEIRAAVEVASAFSGMKPSQIGRQALVEKLCRDGFLRHPGISNYQNGAIKPAE